uniref:Zinc finger protein 804A n=1 Tax=Anthurium amnicola TaxID=1678845 RepID=A0A1D1ZHQ3_9ARAE
MMKIQVVAERELKIQSEVKEIKKAFFCSLCNKQYKLAMEFEVHLSSYDHNHRKRFKEMKEMHATSSRDDRQKREQVRQEKEIAKFAQIAEQRQQQHQEQTGPISESQTAKGVTAVADLDQRQTLKFGFSPRLGASKKPMTGGGAKKPKIAPKISSVFGGDDEDES